MIIVGVDEAGRGCWAGPVYAAAVALELPIPGLKDSKLLTKRQRSLVQADILEQALGYGIGWVPAETIDAIGINASVRAAMIQAVNSLTCSYDKLIVDGNINFLAEYNNSEAIIKADQTVPSVSAAGILAKVARDDFMTQAALQFPGYGFEAHFGYGTAKHLASLQVSGVTALHRKSYKPVRAIITQKGALIR